MVHFGPPIEEGWWRIHVVYKIESPFSFLPSLCSGELDLYLPREGGRSRSPACIYLQRLPWWQPPGVLWNWQMMFARIADILLDSTGEMFVLATPACTGWMD